MEGGAYAEKLNEYGYQVQACAASLPNHEAFEEV